MEIKFYKYQGTGNDFVMIDNRMGAYALCEATINKLCDRRFGIGGDGLILLNPSMECDFQMVYYNADGKESTMCGNGGRCLVAFARDLGYIEKNTTFTAIDGMHEATIENDEVSLLMKDVTAIDKMDKNTCFLDTGSPHHVTLSANVDDLDVVEKGRKIRHGAPYFEEGTNVNFAHQINDNRFKVRTYERGVEAETLACGTGAAAVAIGMYALGKTHKTHIYLAVLGGQLQVTFKPCEKQTFRNIWLMGPAKKVFEGSITLNI